MLHRRLFSITYNYLANKPELRDFEAAAVSHAIAVNEYMAEQTDDTMRNLIGTWSRVSRLALQAKVKYAP